MIPFGYYGRATSLPRTSNQRREKKEHPCPHVQSRAASSFPALLLLPQDYPFWPSRRAPPSSPRQATRFIPPNSPRARINFNLNWKFIREDVAGAEAPDFDDSQWTTISTPHSFNDVDSFRKIISHSGGDLGTYKGLSWYRKHFKLPASFLWPQNLSRIRRYAPGRRHFS
jgi:hypothetical protein